MAEPDDDRDAIDRAFAELVAGYHLTADRPDVPRRTLELTSELTTSDETRTESAEPSETFVLPARPEPRAPQPVRSWTPPTPPTPPPSDERYVPDALPPLARPGAPALVGWTGVLFAAVVVLAAGFGVHLPGWLGWLAVTAFIVGAVVLLTQLPRHRPPDAGDGAVL
jgi:hypothetical protein